jgi:para-nitrobenzyl esterase
MGGFHSSVIPFGFGGDSFPLGKVGSAQPLADAMQGYWTSFAKTGAPAGDVEWPAYEMTTEPLLVLDVPVSTTTGFKSSQCDFWDTL